MIIFVFVFFVVFVFCFLIFYLCLFINFQKLLRNMVNIATISTPLNKSYLTVGSVWYFCHIFVWVLVTSKVNKSDSSQIGQHFDTKIAMNPTMKQL